MTTSIRAYREENELTVNPRMGNFAETQWNTQTDNTMFIVFDTENEACLSGMGVPGDFLRKRRRAPEDQSWMQHAACTLGKGMSNASELGLVAMR